MSALQLDFKFEDKLKKFIEENCPYNFSIVINKSHAEVAIDDYESVSHADIVSDLNNIGLLVDDISADPDTGELEGIDDVEDAIDDLIDKLNA